MDLTRVRECLALIILPLLLLVDTTAACDCFGHPEGPPVPLKTAYCLANDVIKGRFTGVKFNQWTWWAVYDFKVTEVFKGRTDIGDQIKLYTREEGPSEAPCTYKHNNPFNEDQYIVTGQRITADGDTIEVSACSFIRPCNELTAEEEEGLAGEYSSGSHSLVLPCSSRPCSDICDIDCL